MSEIYVVADMEGITGCSSYERELYPHCPDYPRARDCLIADMLAVLDGARDAGVDRFVVYDVHYHADNLVGANLGPGVTLLPGRPADNGMRLGQTGLFIVGLHAMAGCEQGVLPHTYQHDIERITLNGSPVGEIGVEAAGAASLGIPFLFLTADEEGCREARRVAPHVVSVATKRLAANGDVELYPEAATRDRMRQEARRAVERAGSAPPARDLGATEILVRYRSDESADAARARSGAEAVDAWTLRFHGRTTHDAYEAFRRTQIRS